MSFRAILHVQEVFQMRLSIREKDGLRDLLDAKGIGLAFFLWNWWKKQPQQQQIFSLPLKIS